MKNHTVPSVFNYKLLLILMVSGAVYFFQIGERTFHGDEFWSLRTMDEITTSLHSAVYSVFLKLWSLVSLSEGWLRGLSALFALATIPLAYYFYGTFMEEKQAFAAALLLGTSPYLVEYAQQARFYTMFLLGSTVSLWYAVRYLKYRMKGDFLKLLICHAILMFVHGLSGLMLLSELAAFFLTSKKITRGQKIIALVLSLGLLAAIFYSKSLKEMGFNLFAMYTNAVPGYHPGRQISLVAFLKIPLTFYVFALGQSTYPFSVFSVLALFFFLTLFILGFVKLRTEKDLFVFDLALFVIPLIFLYLLLDILCPPTYASASPRYLMFLVPLFYMILAKGIPARFYGRTVVIAVLIHMVCLNNYWRREWSYGDDLINWKTAIQWVEKTGDDKAVIFLDGRSKDAGRFYFPSDWNQQRLEDIEKVFSGGLPEKLFLISANFHAESRNDTSRAVRILEKSYHAAAVYNHYPLFIYYYEQAGTQNNRHLALPKEIYGLEFQDLKLPLSFDYHNEKIELMGTLGLPQPGGSRSETLSVNSAAPIHKITVFSHFISSATYPDGTEVGRLKITNKQGEVQIFPLRKGYETNAWDEDCKKTPCETAFSWNKRIAFLGAHKYPGSWRDFRAHLFSAEFKPDSLKDTASIEIESLLPSGRLYIWGVLYD